LQIVEGTANVLDFSTSLSTYIKISNVMLDGVEVLLGSQGNSSVIGFRKEFDPDAGDVLKPGYFALIDIPESELSLDDLWVRQRRLFYGKNLDEAKPFRNADYVLYSITQVLERSDLELLSFNELYKQMIKKAIKSTTKESWEVTKADMAVLNQAIRFSPDLTIMHANQLREKYKNEMIKEHEKAVAESNLDHSVVMDSELREAASILDL
jgi:hypothetical protein